MGHGRWKGLEEGSFYHLGEFVDRAIVILLEGNTQHMRYQPGVVQGLSSRESKKMRKKQIDKEISERT
jgi:hypothetical protein